MTVTHVKSSDQFKTLISKGVAIVDYSAQWCGPCKMISPIFEKLSSEHTDITFLKVDVDECEDVAADQGISAMPTFILYRDGKKVEDLVGASEAKLRDLVARAKK